DTVSGATTRGRWSMGTYLNSYSGSMETSLGVLILVNRVFGPECQISCPEDIVVKCEGPGGAVVHYDVTTSGCPQGTTIVCSPPSGSLFPVGVTQVQCYALLPCGDKKSLPCCFKVTVEEPCACLEVVDKKIDCGKQQGEYTYSFNVTNLSGVPVTRIKLLPCDMDGDLLPDFTISPDLFNLGTPLPNGSSTTLNVTLSGVDPTKKACFEIWMFDQKFQRCCRLKHCIELPDCCLELVQSKVDCDPVAPGQYNWTFQVQNKAPYTIDRLFLWPPSGITMTPTSFILPPLATGQTSGPLSVQITGGQPGDVLCFEISIHESATDKCCYQTICITLPDCNPCKVEDSCELTPTITLCREGDLLRGVVKLTICNYCNEQPVEFQYALDGFTDPSCPVKYLSPGNFSPSSGATLPLARGECETIAITITSSFGQFPPMSTACYKATITNLATGEQFSCVAKARSPKVNSPIKVVGDPKDPVGIPRDRIRPITFQASSLTSVAASLSYELRTEEPGETSAAVISLNGLPPGTPVRGTLDVPPGAVQLVTVEVRFAVHQPLGFFEVGLYGVSADGQAEALAVTGVRSVDPTDCNQNGVPDDVDILLCNSEDKDGDGIPDECEGTPLVRGQDSFRRGDSNGDGAFDIGDGVCILDYLFLGRKAPACEDAADADDSGTVDMSDAVSVLGYLFLGKAAPAAPGPRECGQDPTDDGLGCAMHLPCN
ncbi:MAG: hypothetical protein HY721_07215, partial [Planctomycetes bacterium]|nr:hypothetical protein [Planctomycetota bacterium]